MNTTDKFTQLRCENVATSLHNIGAQIMAVIDNVEKTMPEERKNRQDEIDALMQAMSHLRFAEWKFFDYEKYIEREHQKKIVDILTS